MENQYSTEKIEAYLLGKLSPEEAASFGKQIESDPELAETVELHRLILPVPQRLEELELLRNFAKWRSEMDSPHPTPPSPTVKPNYWKWATAALLLLSAGAFWFFRGGDGNVLEKQKQETARRDSLQNQINQLQSQLADLLAKPKTSGDSLSKLEIKRLRDELDKAEKRLRETQNSKPKTQNLATAMRFAPPAKEIGASIRGNGDGSNPTLAAAQTAFDNGQFAGAAQLAKNVPPGDGSYKKAIELSAYALFYAQDFREAIPAFQKHWQSNTYEAQRAQFFILLCHANLGEMDAARSMLLFIESNSKHGYLKEARLVGEVLN